MRVSIDTTDIENLYRAVAADDPREEILQRIYDLFGRSCDLRPPLAEQRLAALCKPEARADG